jgi:hypothetical protein
VVELDLGFGERQENLYIIGRRADTSVVEISVASRLFHVPVVNINPAVQFLVSSLRVFQWHIGDLGVNRSQHQLDVSLYRSPAILG